MNITKDIDKLVLENRIISLIDSHQGLKGVTLTAQLVTEFIGTNTNDILDTIFDLIERGEIIEIEYELPSMAYRTKSFLLPRGTQININKVKQPADRRSE